MAGIRSNGRRRTSWCAAPFLLFSAALALPQPNPPPQPGTGQPIAMPAQPPAVPPMVQAFPLPKPPSLDGHVLEDSAWAGVRPTTGFWQVRPFEGRPASQRTEVYVGYTATALYLGVVCYDDDPAGIVVSDSRRDASLEDGDSFLVVIDAFRDRQNGFVFGTNPAGAEYDGQVAREGSGQSTSGGGFNLNWDTTWSVRTAITGIGWTAELEIPFRSLRYGNEGGDQTWGINFQRNIRRINEIAYWSPLSRQHQIYRVSDAGTVQGLEVPPQRNLKVVPYALSRTNRGGELRGTEHDQELGADLKYSLTPSLTLDLTWNTDFAQVEADELVANLDRFSVFFPEKRPFFLENAGQFTVGTPEELELFFSRRIGITGNGQPQPIDGGARLSGKIGGRTNLGLLHMRTEAMDEAASDAFSVARVNQELPNRSAAGVLYVERDSKGSDGSGVNRTYAVDGRLGIGDDVLLSGFAARTRTPGLDGPDHAFSLIAQQNSGRWSNSLGYTEVAENFNPEVGFLRRRDYRKGEARLFRRYRPSDLWGLHELRPHVAWTGFWSNDGFYESGHVHVDNHWEWRSGLEIHTGVNFTHEGVREPFEIVDGVFVPPGEYDHKEAQLVFQTDEGAPLSLAVSSRLGGFYGGDRRNVEPTVRYRVGESFSSELAWSYNDIDLPVPGGDFEVNVGRLRLSYSISPKILLQALVQYDDRTDLVATNLRFAWLQTANAGFYVVYNEIDEDTRTGPIEKRRELVLKYSRIFDLL